MNTLIILHGWKSSPEKWQKVRQLLESPNLQVIIPDLPGFKPANQLVKPWQLDDFVEWLAKKIGEGQTPIFVLGHSFGGRVAIKFAVRYPQFLQGLVLVSSAGIKDKSLKKGFGGFLAKIAQTLRLNQCSCLGFLRKFFYRFILRRTDYLQTDDDLNLKQTMRLAVSEDLTPLLSQIQTPTLLVWGDKDKYTPLKQGKIMQEKIKGSQLEVLRGLGHSPYLDNPEALADKISDFLNRDKDIAKQGH